MIVELGGNFPLSASGREFVKERAMRKLAKFGNLVRGADILIDDQNGPKGGTDIRCLIRTRLNRLPDVVIEETAASLGSALHAIDRAVFTISRTLGRRQSARRRSA
jgi:hypothetical protein